MITLQIDVARHGQTIATHSHSIGRRFELVSLTDSLIDQWELSNRARRQVNLVSIWQAIAKRKAWQWRLHDTMGAGIEICFLAEVTK